METAMAKSHILIVEDEPEIAEILRDYLVKDGYYVSLLDNGDEAFSFIKKEKPVLILLDLMIPGMNGKTLCREIRKFSNVPILMITAKVNEIDRIVGLELGADDYICKPFSPREVVARVKAVLRRVAPDRQDHVLTGGLFRLNRDTHQVFVNDHELILTPSEFEILSVMLANPSRVFSRNSLIEQVQGYSYEGYERTIDFHIKNLRKKIYKYLPMKKIIQSAYGYGYKMVL